MANERLPPFLSNAHGQMRHPKAELLANVLRAYDLAETIALVAGLSTAPRLQANSYRIELLTQIAVAVCDGSKRPTWQHLRTWLNRQLGTYDIAMLEDPAEDVFITNVISPVGDFRVIGGLWEAGDSATTLLVETLVRFGGMQQRAWLRAAIALLRLSEDVVSRSGLPRWHTEPSTPKRDLSILPSTPLAEWKARVTFGVDDLSRLGVSPADIEPFIFDLERRSELLMQSNQESSLHRRPLVRTGNVLVLALPNAVTYAVRRFLLDCAEHEGQLQMLNGALMTCVQQRLIEMLRHGSRHSMTVLPLPKTLSGVKDACKSIIVRVGTRRFLHFVLASDDLRQMAAGGFLLPSQVSPEVASAIVVHIAAVRDHVESSASVDSGHTFWLMGYLGQAFIASAPAERPRWTFQSARLNDLELLFRDPEDPVDRLILLLNQEQELSARGLELPFQNGLLNLYAFWLQQGFYLRIPDIQHDHTAFLQIGTDFVGKYRATRRAATDEHCVPLPSGASTTVQRSNSEAIYDSLRRVPTYVSLDLLSTGTLSFCITKGQQILWVIVQAPTDDAAREATFKLWEALQLLVHRALQSFSVPIDFVAPVVEVVLNFSNLRSQERVVEEQVADIALILSASASHASVELRAEPGFLRNFDGIDNLGERYLLSEFLRALVKLSTHPPEESLDLDGMSAQILGSSGARILHTFRVWHDVDFLLASDSRPVYRRPEEHIVSAMRSAFTWMPAPAKANRLDASQSTGVLNTCVARQAERLAEKLRQLDRTTLIRELLHLHETLLRDKQRWRATARAVRALYGLEDGTRAAAKVERERAQLQISLRALVEAATCECKQSGGKTPDEYCVDELVGSMTTLINLGRDSDIIHFGLSTQGITLFPNGSHDIDADLLTQFAEPFMAETFGDGYASAAANYEDWVGKEGKPKNTAGPTVFDSPDFRMAWQAEYGHSFEAFREISGELQDLAVKRGAVVLDASADEIVEARSDFGVTKGDVEAFLEAFGLPKRTTWPAQAPHAAPKDVNPWRFERRLSISLRPLVLPVEGTGRFVYGVGTARESIGYVLESIRAASFDKDVFRSKEMRAWLGGRVDELGRQFTEHVADKLRAAGWMAVTEVKLTQLGAPKNPNLGDVDVLAWQPGGTVLAIECKRLKASRTIAEMAQSCDRFRGNVGDRLHKHVRRATWIRANVDKLAAFTKLSPDAIRIRSPLVVSRPVPFKYLQSLPIPSSDIVGIETLMKLATNE